MHADASRPFERRHRARFDALRREIFAEMGHAAARWRLAWLVPFHLFVITLLLVRGNAPVRVAIQAAAMIVSIASFIWRVRATSDAMSFPGLCIGACCY